MTIDTKSYEQRVNYSFFTGLSTDTKLAPTDTDRHAYFYESDTGRMFEYNLTNWDLVKVGGAQLVADFYTEVAKGSIPGHSTINKYGRAPTSTINVESSVSDLGLMQFPAAASAMRVKAGGNAADTAAGAGAREITIYGLDETGAYAEEAVATAGASASAATTITFLRIFRARVTSAGTYATTSIATVGVNQAAVTIEDSGSAADYVRIPAFEGTTEYAGYHVALGTTAYMIDTHINVDAAKSSDVVLYQRRDILDSTAPMQSRRVVNYIDGVAGNVSVDYKGPVSFPALTDIWFNFIPSANGTECSVNFELLIVED